MQVILLERVAKLGQMGDVVDVKSGYARNFLLPQGKAKTASAANLAAFETMKAQLEARNLETKAEAEALKKRLDKGEDFAKLARKHSTCNSAKRGGDLGELRPGQLVPAINQIVFKKALNQIHGPTKSKFGFHLVEVYYRD